MLLLQRRSLGVGEYSHLARRGCEISDQAIAELTRSVVNVHEWVDFALEVSENPKCRLTAYGADARSTCSGLESLFRAQNIFQLKRSNMFWRNARALHNLSVGDRLPLAFSANQRASSKAESERVLRRHTSG